ncbi:MAG: YkgJ family cysteine cluster protein [Planctomycetes bacterium]|nr:YkgJ family cysteine cluster protein [Planctomycetota bacterium]
MTRKTKKAPWYVAGLHFECTGCGNCCAGPDEGYIWLTKPEIQRLAKFLGMTVEKTSAEFLRRIGNRYSINENLVTKDCVFLTDTGTGKGCAVYPVRPNQCRTWPFWNYNLDHPDDWNQAAAICSGINRGKLYTFQEIEALRKQKKWWSDE